MNFWLRPWWMNEIVFNLSGASKHRWWPFGIRPFVENSLNWACCKSKTGRHNQDRSRCTTNHKCIVTRPVLIVATGLGFATRPWYWCWRHGQPGQVGYSSASLLSIGKCRDCSCQIYKPYRYIYVRINHAPHRPVYEHAPVILAAPAVYCIHGRIIDQAKNHQAVQNVTEKHAPSLSAATANTHRPSNCSNF